MALQSRDFLKVDISLLTSLKYKSLFTFHLNQVLDSQKSFFSVLLYYSGRMPVSACDRSRCVVSHILIHYLRVKHSTPSPWGVEFLRRLCSLFFLLALSFTIVFGTSKSGFQVNGSVLTQLNEYKLMSVYILFNRSL